MYTKYLSLFSTLIFFIGVLFGSVSEYHENYELIHKKSSINHEFNKNPPNFGYILLNNLRVTLLLSFGGVLTFGGLTLLNLVLNGIYLGTTLQSSLILGELKTFFLLILPHGIFEIPGLIIAGSAGFKIPYELLKFALGKKEEIITEKDAKEFFKLVGISIALILIAAIVESTITMKIAEKLA